MYQVVQCIKNKRRDKDFGFCMYAEDLSSSAAKLYNASLFRIHQIFTGWEKTKRTAHEEEVFQEVEALQSAYPNVTVRRVISYFHLEKLMRVTENPDFFSGLPMQTAQAVVKQAVQDFKNWLAALRAWKKDPSSFFGLPKMPGYKKHGRRQMVPFSNQDAVIYRKEDRTYLKFPKTKEILLLPDICPDARLKEAKLCPFYDSWKVCLVLETEETLFRKEQPEDFLLRKELLNLAALDFGVSNIVSLAVNDGYSLICKGGAMKSEIRRFEKLRAERTSLLSQRYGNRYPETAFLKALSREYLCFMNDQCHKISRYVIDACIRHQVGTLILGINKNWKQNSHLGANNNQMFSMMPISRLKDMLTYKAQQAGIRVIEQEESYTSKADFLVGDAIPVYGDRDIPVFSGRRTSRGLYKSGSGSVVNADLNAAANILRKALPQADLSRITAECLSNPEVADFKTYNKCKPVERLEGAVNHPLTIEKETGKAVS